VETAANGRKLNAKDRILKAGTTVFSKKGYSETTISEIARGAGVSDASVYQHFGGKEELFLAVGSQRAKGGAERMEEQLFGIKSALAQLRKFVWLHVRNLMEDREVTKIALLHLKTSKTFLGTDAYKDVQKLYGKIIEIIELGQKSGEIRPGINVYIARSILLGSIEHLLVRWLLRDCSYNLWPFIEEAYELVESALRETPKLQIHVSYESPEAVAATPKNRTAGVKEEEPDKTEEGEQT
jgi:TetR/AcrR family fatty acid metabolism transcriptional regulator